MTKCTLFITPGRHPLKYGFTRVNNFPHAFMLLRPKPWKFHLLCALISNKFSVCLYLTGLTSRTERSAGQQHDLPQHSGAARPSMSCTTGSPRLQGAGFAATEAVRANSARKTAEKRIAGRLEFRVGGWGCCAEGSGPVVRSFILFLSCSCWPPLVQTHSLLRISECHRCGMRLANAVREYSLHGFGPPRY